MNAVLLSDGNTDSIQEDKLQYFLCNHLHLQIHQLYAIINIQAHDLEM